MTVLHILVNKSISGHFKIPNVIFAMFCSPHVMTLNVNSLVFTNMQVIYTCPNTFDRTLVSYFHGISPLTVNQNTYVVMFHLSFS